MNRAAQILPLSETTAPTDQAALAEVIADASRSKTPVYPIGGGTGLHYGPMPVAEGLGLSLARLNQLIDYPKRDLTITVAAGMTITELSKRLAHEGQRLPVDVPQPDRATVGGAVAVNPNGAARFGWGSLRDYVIGLSAVDGLGTPFSGGGRVVKNAAGYDLCRLLTGSLGTLAVITQVTLMIKPVPETSAWAVCELSELDVAERLLVQLVTSETRPSAVELLAGPAWDDDPALGAASSPQAVRLAVGFEGSRAEVDWMLETIRHEWQRLDVAAGPDVRSHAAGRLWDRLREFPAEDPEGDDSAPVVAAIRVPPSVVVRTLSEVHRADPGVSIQAHAGHGVVCLRFALPAPEAIPVLNERLRPVVAVCGGSIVVTSYPTGLAIDRESIWGPPIDDAGVMQAIKDRFDPQGILNPGRFVI